MAPDKADKVNGGGRESRTAASREEQRAASLRANLQRRKAQARERAELARDDVKPAEAAD